MRQYFFKFALLLLIYLLFLLINFSSATYCYECTSTGTQDSTCGHYVGTSCGYGFFGCVKIAIISGGVNKSEFFCK